MRGPGGEAHDELRLALLVQVTHDGKNVATQGVMWRRDGDQLAVSPMPSRSVLAEVARYEQAPIVLTSNRTFSEWGVLLRG